VSDAFAGRRIGSVPYLNARPLIAGLEDRVSLDLPSRLAERFAAGELDAALVPVYEAVERPSATIADGIAIAACGAVFSVYVAHRGPLTAQETIALDPASHTSNHLLQCLLAEFYDFEPAYLDAPADELGARLLIGDAAVKFRQTHAADGWEFFDLGAEWMRCTGLPFVFACWVFRPELPAAAALADALRDTKVRGLAERERIAAEYPDPAFVRRYLSEFIRFDLGAEEKQAIALFATLLRKHGFVNVSGEADLRYV
jgi:predicted solute-binding protein